MGPEPSPAGMFLRRYWKRISLGAILLLTILFARPLYHLANTERAHWLARAATKLGEQGQLDLANQRATAAFQMKPEDPATWRAMAKVLSLRNDPAALSFWLTLINSPDASAEDRRGFIEAALAWRQMAEASEQMQILMASDPNSPINNLLAARVQAVTGRYPGALAAAQRAHELDPSNQDATLFLGSLLVGIPGADRASGMELLWNLAGSDSREGLDASALLAGQKRLSPEEQDRLIKRLEHHPLTDEAHRLIALDLKLARHPEQRESLLDAEQASHAGEDGESVRQIGAWPNTRGEYARVTQLITLGKALHRKDLFLIYLDALASQKKWSEIVRILKRGNVPLEDTYVDLFLSRAYAELGDSTESEFFWRGATVDSDRKPDQAFYMAGYAERLGLESRAEELYRTLSQRPDTASRAYQALLRLSIPKGTAATLAVLKEMHQHWPKNEAISNDFAYMELLMKEDIAGARAEAAELCEKYPRSLPHRTTLALACLRSGDAAGALQVYAGLDVDWQGAPASSAAVYAAVLNANGRTAEAEKIASQIHRGALRPEELELLKFGK